MEIVIEIDEAVRKRFCCGIVIPSDSFAVADALYKGTPLPKGHGRIVDENKITSFGWNNTDNHAVVDAPTIIKADKEEK